MLYVLGLGVETPETVIDNSLLKKLNPSLDVALLESDIGIRSRRSALPLEIIQNAGNVTPAEAFKAVTKTPSVMAHTSALRALECAGIQKEQIGLLIGDCATPTETCPSEGQRLGCSLGLKVPAYDIIAASGAFIVHLATLGRWNEDRCPEYVLGTTSGTITHTIDYTKGITGALFGDGAASYVLSTKHTGKLRVVETGFKVEAHHSRDLKVETYGHTRIPESYVSEFVRPHVAATITTLKKKYGSDFATSRFIGAQSDVLGSARAAIAAGFSEQSILSNGGTCGDMLGASIPAVLADSWSTLKKGEKIFVVQSGFGIASGHIVFEVTE